MVGRLHVPSFGIPTLFGKNAMKKTIKTIGEIVLFMFVSLVPALAQSLRMEPLPAPQAQLTI